MDPFFALPLALHTMLAAARALAQGEGDEYTAARDEVTTAPLARREDIVDDVASSVAPFTVTAAKPDVLDWASPVFVWVEPGYAYAEGTVAF